MFVSCITLKVKVSSSLRHFSSLQCVCLFPLHLIAFCFYIHRLFRLRQAFFAIFWGFFKLLLSAFLLQCVHACSTWLTTAGGWKRTYWLPWDVQLCTVWCINCPSVMTGNSLLPFAIVGHALLHLTECFQTAPFYVCVCVCVKERETYRECEKSCWCAHSRLLCFCMCLRARKRLSGVFWFIRAACFSMTLSCVCIHVHVVCVLCCVNPVNPPDTHTHTHTHTPLKRVSVLMSCGVCVSAHCFYATLSEAPSGLDNTSLLLLSVSHSSLFPSPWRGREGVKKKKKRRWVGGQWK